MTKPRTAVRIAALSLLIASALIAEREATVTGQELRPRVACSDPRGARPFCVAREFEVVSTGATEDQARAVADALQLDAALLESDGGLQFADPNRFLFAPTVAVRPVETPTDEHGRPTAIDAFDLDALKRTTVLSREDAIRRAHEALRRSRLLPPGAVPNVSHARLEIRSPRSDVLASAALDTTVSFTSSLMGIPLRGPGAKTLITFDGDGAVTHVRQAWRTLREGPMVRIMTPDQARQQCAARYGFGADARRVDQTSGITAELLYYAPPLTFGRAERIVPHYACGGTIDQEGERIDLLKVLVPAVEDGPTVDLTVETEPRRDGPAIVRAHADVRGGRPPYMFSWNSAHTTLDAEARTGGPDITYEARGRNELEERVGLTVTDADGLIATASESIFVLLTPPGETEPSEWPSIGVEWISGGLSNTWDNAAGFWDAFQPTNVVEVDKKFNKGTQESREIDFKDVNRDPDGRDHNWVDDVDLLFYVGHGNPNGWVMHTTEEDTLVHFNDAQFGDKNLEWLVLNACKVLQAESNGQTLEARWGPAFAGLHSLVGFATSEWDLPGQGPGFAERILGKNGPAMSIVDAWGVTVSEIQWGVDYAAMGPVSLPQIVATAGGTIEVHNISTYNDFFWNRGPVGPDITGVLGYWVLSVHVD